MGCITQSGNQAEGEKALRKSIALAEKFMRELPNDENLFNKVAPVYLFPGNTLPVGTGADENIAAFDKVIEESEKFLAAHPGHLKASN